jgi:uncharacterized protein YjiK
MKYLPTLFISILLLLFSCSSDPKIKLPFDFNHPAEVIKLPQKLHEISGITFYKKNELACVQDEKGIIYFYNIKKDKLRNTITFAKDKDYEGITNVNDTLFVLCSNGEISEVDSTSETGYAHTYSTFLSKENNCEGICYDNRFHRLLIACKGKPKKKTAPRGDKAVYSFNLDTRKLEEQPAYVIDPDSVKKHLVNISSDNIIEKIFSPETDDNDFQFDPSELCIDPLTEDIYMLSSVGKTILALSYDGKIKFACHLDSRLFKQPEGISFSRDGSMFISDEGKGGKANLVKINRIVS